MNAAGRSLELYFIDGRPDGMLTAEVFNWTGHVLRAPRTQIREALGRDEARRTGVYLLLGEVDGRARLYVGEAEDIGSRLRDHVKAKEWWEQVILITTTGDALHKAHVKYLEARLVEIARDVGAIALENGNTPPRSSLSEAATASMESFLDTLMMVLPAIRVDAFLSRKRVATNPLETAAQASREVAMFIFRLPKQGIEATAKLLDGEWIMQAGSTVRLAWAGDRKYDRTYQRLHDELRERELIVPRGSVGELTQDYAFSSATAAGAIAGGVGAYGRSAWIHTETGQTYAEWEAAQIEKDDAHDPR